jgi:hypothetical protein
MSLIDPITKIKDIASVIKTGDAFANPFSATLITTGAAITQLKGLATGALVGSLIQPHAATILSSIATIESTLLDFTSHSDSLSGVGLSEGLTGSNFATMASVVKTAQKYTSEGGVCSIANGAFGAIVKARQIIAAIENLQRQLGELLLFPERIAAYLDTLETLLRNQIINDLTAFAQAQLDALQASAAGALAEFFGDPCLAGIASVVATDAVKSKLNILPNQSGLDIL